MTALKYLVQSSSGPLEIARQWRSVNSESPECEIRSKTDQRLNLQRTLGDNQRDGLFTPPWVRVTVMRVCENLRRQIAHRRRQISIYSGFPWYITS